jgi:hypothetical protein
VSWQAPAAPTLVDSTGRQSYPAVSVKGHGPANQWRGAYAIYSQPELTNQCAGQHASLATWTGVGGVIQHDPFFQAGTNEPFGFNPLTLRDNLGLVTGKGWTELSHLGHLRRQVMQEINSKEEQVGQIMASPGPILADGRSFTETWNKCHP